MARSPRAGGDGCPDPGGKRAGEDPGYAARAIGRDRRMNAFAALPALLLAAACAAAEEPSMAEQADTLEFEKFHRSAGENTPLLDLGGVLGQKRVEGVDVFDRELDNPNGKGVVQTEDLAAPDQRASTGGSRFNLRPGPPPTIGEAMNIRVRYTLTRSEFTPFLAHTAAHALHSYIADHCPGGWIKLAEWSLPVGGDHYLYYQFRCAER
jgi:hypothetical protein